MYVVPQLRGDEKAKYLRKSQTDDPLLTVEEVLQKHDQMLDDWVTTHQPEGGPIPPQNVFREIGSGETISARPQIQKLLRLIESPKIKAIMVTEPSRLTRGDLEDIGYLVKILRYTKTLVITLNYTYDLTEERDRSDFERELMRGNEYLEYTKKIRNNGRLAAVKAGAFIGQKAPYGYRKTTIMEGRRTIHTLEPDPETAPVVKRIFELYASGLGWVKIADILDREHIPAPKGGSWTCNSIPRILDNDHYIGKVHWGRRKTVRTVEEGVVSASRPVAEQYLVFDGRHPAIIDMELWNKVQAIKGTHPRNHKASNLSNPLAGLMWCECGRAMVGRPYYDKNGDTRAASRFHCPSVGDKRCGNASSKMMDVMAEVLKVLESTLEDFEIQLEAGTDDSADLHQEMIARMEKRLEELRELEVQQWAEKMESKMPAHVFKRLNDPVVKEIEDLESDLHEARELVPEPINIEEKIVTLRSTIEALKDTEAPVKEKNRLLKSCIERIEYSREKYTAVGTPKGMVETPIKLHFTLKL